MEMSACVCVRCIRWYFYVRKSLKFSKHKFPLYANFNYVTYVQTHTFVKAHKTTHSSQHIHTNIHTYLCMCIKPLAPKATRKNIFKVWQSVTLIHKPNM